MPGWGRWVIAGVLLLVAGGMVVVASTLTRLREAQPLAARMDLNDKGSALRTVTVYFVDADTLQLTHALREVAGGEGRAELARELVEQLTLAGPEGEPALPEGTRLLHYFETETGVAVLDFNAEVHAVGGLGILSERMHLDALIRTLAENLVGVDRMQLLVYGQPMVRWGNHIDLPPILEVTP